MHPISLREQGIYNDRVPQTRDYPLERITIPTLVIHAEDDSLISFSNGRHTARGIPGAQFVRFQSGGHLLLGQYTRIALVKSE